MPVSWRQLASARSPRSRRAARPLRSRQASSSCSDELGAPWKKAGFAGSEQFHDAGGGRKIPSSGALLAQIFIRRQHPIRWEFSTLRWPQPIGSPVLDSLRPVIEHSRDVQTHVDKITEVAGWMAYEDLPVPEYALPFGIGAHDVNVAIDFIMTSDTIDTAFTDFSTHVKFQTDYAGQHWSDSDAEFACLKRAMDNGIPVLDGKWMASVTRAELEEHFRGQYRNADAR